MSFQTTTKLNETICNHEMTLTDVREGVVICSQCSFVLDSLVFAENFYAPTNTEPLYLETQNSQKDGEVLELLSRLNLPDSYYQLIIQDKNFKKNVPQTMYKVLNNNKCPISINDIKNVSEKSSKKCLDISNNVIILQTEELLQKFCAILNIDFKNFTLIKEQMKKFKTTGHNPVTIVASAIYIHCKKNKIRISMKKIANEMKISPVSIQRYLKQ